MNKNKILLNLVLEYQKSKDEKVLKKIIDLNKDLIDWYLNNVKTAIPKDEFYNLIIDGIDKACLKYNNQSLNVLSFISLGIRNTINYRTMRADYKDKRLFANFLEVKSLVEKKYGISLEKDISILDDILDEMLERNLILKDNYEDTKIRILKILKDYYGNLKLITNKTSEDFTEYPFELPIDLDNFYQVLKDNLTSQEYDLICSYFGLLNREMLCLDEIGKKYNISLERTRQIKDNALNKLKIAMEFSFIRKVDAPYSSKQVEEFLKRILNKDEYNYLVLKLGLFNNKQLSSLEIANLYNLREDIVDKIIYFATSKIIFALNNYQKDNSKIKEVKDNLKSILTDMEFEIFCYIYGVYGKEQLSLTEIIDKEDLSSDRVYKTNQIINLKIREAINDNLEIENSLKEILTKEEFESLAFNYGLFNHPEKTIKELVNMMGVSKSVVSKNINLAISKIIVLLNIHDLDYDLSLIKVFLEKILSSDEYNYFCGTMGLYGKEKQSRIEIAKNNHLSYNNVLNSNRMVVKKIKSYL